MNLLAFAAAVLLADKSIDDVCKVSTGARHSLAEEEARTFKFLMRTPIEW